MKHIRQKDLSTYTIVITDNWTNSLEEHPSILQHPEIFEIADCEVPENHQYLNYEI